MSYLFLEVPIVHDSSMMGMTWLVDSRRVLFWDCYCFWRFKLERQLMIAFPYCSWNTTLFVDLEPSKSWRNTTESVTRLRMMLHKGIMCICLFRSCSHLVNADRHQLTSLRFQIYPSIHHISIQRSILKRKKRSFCQNITRTINVLEECLVLTTIGRYS